MFHVKIDGKDLEFEKPLSILEAARTAGIEIPSLCYDQRLEAYGGCRLCLVQVEGHGRPDASCTTTITDGMKVSTSTESIRETRRNLLEMMVQEKGMDTGGLDTRKDFYRYLVDYGVVRDDSRADMTPARDSTGHPFISVDMTKCIDCYRCVRICDEVQGQFVWRKWNRGHQVEIRPDVGNSLLESSCVSCGACSDTCPTGAIEDVSVIMHGYPEKYTRSVCPYCGTGCEISIGTRDDRIVEILPVLDSPVSKGHLCVKGRYSFGFVDSPDRVTDPMIRRNGIWQKATWDEALELVASEFSRILKESGPDSIGILGSSRATNEENYLTQKFARTVIGTNNVDGCARVCHAPTAGGMGALLGTGAATNSFDDIEMASTFLIVGANPTENHPIVGARIKQQVLSGSKLIVIDPRKTELASMADYHLQIRPGTDIPLINAMANAIVEAKAMDQDFLSHRVSGFEDYLAEISRWTPEKAAEVCGVDAHTIREAALLYETGGPAMMFHGLGITEHVQGTEGVMSLVDLALLTGNIGKRGSGVNPLRGQNNVQGSAHMGVEPSKLTGYVTLDAGREKFQEVWGAEIPTTRGKDEMELIDAALAGTVKSLWVIGWDVYMTNPDMNTTARAFSNLEFVVIQDLFMNETARKFGNVFLPAVSSYEKDGTFMNSERRVQRVRKALNPRGNSRADWEIIRDLAGRMGKGRLFDYGTPEDIWNEIRKVWDAGSGITYPRMESGGIQWPCYSEDSPGTQVLHVDAFSLGRTTRIRPISYRPTPEKISQDYPILLSTGRSLFQFNAATMTGRSGNDRLRDADIIQISPADARKLAISQGEEVQVVSAYGSSRIRASIDEGIVPGTAFATFNKPETELNRITGNQRDNLQHTPEYKVTAVRIDKI